MRRQSAPRFARRRARGQSGATLVEVLMMLVVAVPLVLTASLGMFSAAGTSSATLTRQHLEAALTSYGESLRVMPVLEPCTTAAALEQQWSNWTGRWQPDAVPGAGTPELSVVEVTHWNASTAAFDDACAGDGEAAAAQRVVVRVALGEQSLTGTIVRRDLS